MYSRSEREEALDLWFAMSGEMSLERFVAEPGWPSASALSRWARDDPRFDPDRPQHRSRPVLAKLELVRRVAEGASYGRAAKEAGVSKSEAFRIVKMCARGGTAALLPKPRREEGRMAGGGRGAGPARPAPRAAPEVPAEPPDDPAALKALVRGLEMDDAILREVLGALKAGPGREPAALTNREKTAIAANLQDRFGAAAVCRRLGLARSTFCYDYGAITAPDPREALADEVRRAFEVDGASARGCRFVREAPVRRLGGPVSEKAVRDVMRERGLVVRHRRRPRRRSSYAGEPDEAPANLPLREDGAHDFSAPAPNVRRVGDITEFRLPGGAKVYLSPVVDLFDGRPVAWSVGARPDAELANSSLRAACSALREGERPVVHTDRGGRYRWGGWKGICEEAGPVRSMSRKGCSPDNAAMEGFFGRLKNEFFYGRDWSGVGVEDFCAALDGWVGGYGPTRLRAFRTEGGAVYDTIDGRRRKLGLAS